jgi:hypothetical protein
MTPLPVNPTVVVLTDENNVVIRIATNVDLETKVVVTNSKETFEAEALGKPFNFTPAD